MLSNDDLSAIGAIVDEKIQANNGLLDKKFDEKLEPVLEAIREGFGEMEAKMATKSELAAMRHELMDHTDRTVNKAVGDLRADLREANVLAS